MIQRAFKCTKDVQLVHTSGGTDGGVGAGLALSVGKTPGGTKTRTEFEFQYDWAGATEVVQAMLRLKVTDTCASPGGATEFYVERVTESFKEGTYADTCGVGADNAEKWPGASSTATGHVHYTGTPSDGDVLGIDITALVEADRAGNVTKGRFRLVAEDETDATQYCGFWSREKGNDGAGYRPRIEATIDDRIAPDAPQNVTPATTNYQDVDEQATRVDRTFTVKARFTSTDPNGDYATASQVQFYPATATDNADGDILTGTEIQTITGTGVVTYAQSTLALSQTVTVPASLVGKTIQGRMRARGRTNRWGAWTRLDAMQVIPNSRPTKPNGLWVDTGSPRPDFRGRHNDPDKGSTVSAVETQMVVQSAAGVEVLLNQTSYHPELGDSDRTVGANISTINGDGAQTVTGGSVLWKVSSQNATRDLRAGERARVRHRTVDQFGAVGDFSEWLTWIVGQGAVPIVTPDAATKQDDLTPLLTVTYRSTITYGALEAYLSNDLASVKLWASGKVAASGTSKSIEYGAVGSTPVDLSWGQVIWVRGKIWTSTAQSPWTELQPVQINRLPLAPAISVNGAVQDANGVWIVPSKTPRLIVPFLDSDLPNDSASKQVAQVFKVPAGNTPLWAQTLTSGIEDFVDVPVAGGLAWETDYLAQIRYADTSRQVGPFGTYRFRTHRPPTVTAGTAPDDNDPTPTINWAATFYASATQKGYQVLIDDVTGGGRDHVHDSGFVEDDSATSYDVPAYVLEDAHDYEVFVYITDTFGIAGLLIGSAPSSSAEGLIEMTATMTGTVSVAPSGNAPADTFTRSVSDSWGTSSSGHTYDYQGDLTAFDVATSVGTLALAAGVELKANFHGAAILNPTIAAKFKTDKLAVGGQVHASVQLRAVDLSNHYLVKLAFLTDQHVDLRVFRVVGGSPLLLASYRTAITHATGTFYWIKATISGTALQAKAWVDGDSEPSYQIAITDTTAALQVAGSVGMGALASPAITNATVTVTVDSFSTT